MTQGSYGKIMHYAHIDTLWHESNDMIAISNAIGPSDMT